MGMICSKEHQRLISKLYLIPLNPVGIPRWVLKEALFPELVPSLDGVAQKTVFHMDSNLFLSHKF